MGHLLLRDDDTDLISEQVRHSFLRHRVGVAGTGTEGLQQGRTQAPT